MASKQKIENKIMKIIKLNLKINHKADISAWHCSSSKHNISAFYKVLLQFRPRKTQTNQYSKRRKQIRHQEKMVLGIIIRMIGLKIIGNW